MRLPDLVGYQTAVQHPATAFADPELRASSVATGRLGLPRAVAGNFAVTYQLNHGARQWAVRCFHREAADRASRYAAISQSLARLRGGPLVPIEYVESGVRVGNAWFPITKMPWIDGWQLNRAVEQRLSTPYALEELERRFVELVAELRRRGIAHGDLQHGNILVDTSGTLRLVDYDGMFVPALHGRPASESGDPNYQHPRRALQFDADLDRFASRVIVAALRALAIRPGLWSTYNTGDNLLFRRSDFVDPARSPLFQELYALAPIREAAERIAKACGADYAQIPPLESVLAVQSAGPAIVKANHVAVLNRLYGPRPKRKAARTWKLRRAVVQHAIAFSFDGALLATGDGDGKICVREAATGRTVRTLRMAPAAGTPLSLAFTRPGRLIAALAERAVIRIWDATNKRLLHELELGGGNARSLALSSNASWLAVGSADGTVRRLQANGRSVGAWVQFGSASVVAVSPDGRYVASAGPRTRVHVWSFPAGQLVGRLSVGRGITCLAFTPDGSCLAVGTTAGRVSLWDLAKCELAEEALALAAPLESVALSPDGLHLASTGRDGSIWMRRLAKQDPVQRPRLLDSAVVISSGYRLFDWLRRVALL